MSLYNNIGIFLNMVYNYKNMIYASVAHQQLILINFVEVNDHNINFMYTVVLLINR